MRDLPASGDAAELCHDAIEYRIAYCDIGEMGATGKSFDHGVVELQLNQGSGINYSASLRASITMFASRPASSLR